MGNDEASDLSPTSPNPGAGGLPGALIFAGTGPGRIGSDTLTSGWNGWGPRLGFAYSVNSKTAIRGAASRSFGPLTYEGSSSHNLGIVQRITVTDQSQGLNPLWVLQNGAPAWAQVPDIDPSVGNGSNVPYYNGKAASTPSDELTYAFNIERQLTANSVLEVGYLATLAADIQSNLLAYNQINFANLPASLNPFTAVGPHLAELAGRLGRRQRRRNYAALVGVQLALGHRGDRGAIPAALPAVFDCRYHQWPGRQDRPLHLSCYAGEVLAPVFLGLDRAGLLRAFENGDGRGRRTAASRKTNTTARWKSRLHPTTRPTW